MRVYVYIYARASARATTSDRDERMYTHTRAFLVIRLYYIDGEKEKLRECACETNEARVCLLVCEQETTKKDSYEYKLEGERERTAREISVVTICIYIYMYICICVYICIHTQSIYCIN